ncbi:acetylcholinesterase-like [Sphaerodactylus townsendi]|uniref:acetylcholinesterase-like n=1 Tax=Sphaerodactylus townsendi TaxID=933632 RepID=UPI00202718DD|nr:acetylcholinesterase-like [Sphaerodactylus townsendi]
MAWIDSIKEATGLNVQDLSVAINKTLEGAAMSRLLLWSLSFLVFSIPESKSSADDGTVVVTTNGAVQGKYLLAGSRSITAYLGIPYAEPPVGKLRFQKPVPHKPWSHILEATNFGNSCPQRLILGTPDEEMWSINTPLSEDCLFLNVWVPHPRPSTPAAVLVWIHGGAFVVGTTAHVIYDGAFLAATENVIVVSMNYRLGALGFLSLPPAAPGNMGLLDQQLALRWVRENVAAFGGDPTRITIFGESAGGASVHYHLLSPGSQPLFDRAVLQSGTAILPSTWLNPEEAKRNALDLAQVMGCTEDEGSAIVNCLQEKPLEEFQTSMSSIMDPKIVLNLPFVPTTDGDFLPDDPQKLVESRRFHAKPIMIGTTSDEGSILVYYAAPLLNTSNECLLTWEKLLEGLKLIIHNGTDDVIHSIARRYSEAEPEGPEQYRSALSLFWGDYSFVSPANEVATETAKTGSPVYAYIFTHRSVGSVWPEWMGSFHGSEVAYLFGTLTLLPGTNETHTEAELALIPQVMRYWAEFARSGNPTPSEVGEAKWPLYNPEEQNFFRISTEPPQVMKPSPARHCSFWKTLLSQASSPDQPPRDSLPSSPEVNKKEEL